MCYNTGDKPRGPLETHAMRSCLLVLTSCVLVLLQVSPLHGDERDRLKVGVQPDGRIVVPTNQILKPAGKQVTFPGRPVDLAFADDGKTVVVKNMNDLIFLDAVTGKIKQTLDLPRVGRTRLGFSVVGLAVQGDRVWASEAKNQIVCAKRQADGMYQWEQTITIPKPKVGGEPHPAGMCIHDTDLWVTATRSNAVHRINLKTNKVEETVEVGVAPFTIVGPSADRFYVSNWGGDPPKAGDPQAKSSDTPIKIDPRTSVANHGSVSVLEKTDGQWKQAKTMEVGLHPSGMALVYWRNFLCVANANSDTISIIETRTLKVVETISCRPEKRLPFGSGTNALAIAPGGKLYAANGTNNCLAVIQLAPRYHVEARVPIPLELEPPSKLIGMIPTGWYPGAVLPTASGERLFVANIKGHGSLSRKRPHEDKPRPDEKGMNSHDHLGSVSIIDFPMDGTFKQFEQWTDEVNHNNRLAYSLAGLEKPRPDAKPVPLPVRHGEPSVFKHVVYVIKENRTYDQIFGGMKEGKGDPKLVMFGEDVTPNHHKLAREFTLFDNFYCSGVLSADGHTWCNEAYVSDYLERSFGGFTRSYPDDGTDPLAYVPTGFLWDNALSRKKTIRNYGEYVTNDYPKGATWTDFYRDYTSGAFKLKVPSKANVKALAPHTHPGYPWFPLHMPDVYRAKLFIDDLKEFEKHGEMPNLIYLTLPCDHTEGTRPGFPTPRAMVADNDLALGMVVEALTQSKFWKDTCIFIVEDDPQNGFDHVDSHRTVALVISPHTKRKFVDSTCYNQTGMVKSIELMLGLPPMNQLDLSATPMRNCFTEKADLTPYKLVKNRIPLDEMNKKLSELSGKELYWAKKSMEQNLDEGDKADEDTLNRILWHATRGYDTPYPERYAGRKSD